MGWSDEECEQWGWRVFWASLVVFVIATLLALL